MPTTIPLASIDAAVSDRRPRSAPASQARLADNRITLWIVLAIVGLTIAAGVLLPAPSDSAAIERTTWLVGP